LNPLLGIWQLARGRAQGMARFGSTTQAFLASLAPLIAFPLVGAVIVLMREGALAAFLLFTVTLIAQLAPPVLSHALAAWWGREQQWLHYATAYNWCYWALPVVLVLLMTLFGVVATATGMPEMLAAQAVVVLLAAYSLWLHWFLARHGLGLSRGRAALLVVIVNAGTLALAFGPRFLV